ncbi:MAG: biotin/lipoyl-binding protein [Chitinophagales bacterium]
MVKPKILYFSLLSFAILSAFSSCSSSESGAPNAQQQQARPFPVVEVSARDIESYDEYPTEITGKNDNQLRPKISGYITKVLVDEGDKVSKGQVLFRLETNMLSQNANAAEASVEAAKSNVTSAQVGSE